VPIPVTCSKCGRNHQAPDSLAGKGAKCPCGAAMTIPMPPSAAPAAFDPSLPTTVMCRCFKCHEEHVLPIQYAGKQANCPSCGQLIVVPFPKGVQRPNTLLDELTENDWHKALNPHGAKVVEKNPHGSQLDEFAKKILAEGADEFSGTPRTVYLLLIVPAYINIALMIAAIVMILFFADQIPEQLRLQATIQMVVAGVAIFFDIFIIIAGEFVRKGHKAGKLMSILGAVCTLLFTPFGLIFAILLFLKIGSPAMTRYYGAMESKRARRLAETRGKK
jgi:hypothetical protein